MIASLHIILPELYLAAMALFLLMAAAFTCKEVSNAMLAGALFALAATAWFLWPRYGLDAQAFSGMFATSGFIVFIKLLILSAAALVILISGDWLKAGKKPSEFLVLMLFAVLGMLLMVSAADFLTLYMALELSSLALYVLAAFDRDNAKSSEAGLKYFVLSSLASGMLLFGISLIYGFAGTTSFDTLAQVFSGGEAVSKGDAVGLVLVIVAFCFKLSAVPFHMWAPDVYEGAPTPVTAFFATAPKIAALALFTRLLLGPFAHLINDWEPVIVLISVASMLVGALAAIMQTSIKRLLAYSSIGHVGFMLMGLASANHAGVQAMLIYLVIYIFMSAGAFGCVVLMRRGGNPAEKISDLSGLAQTRPVMALALAVFMFSLAGIPPLAGFFGKLYVVMAAVKAGLAWLAVIGVITSVIGCYYYLKVVRVMYFDDPAQSLDADTPPMLKAGIAIAAAITLCFFLLPTPLVAAAKIAAEVLIK